ncbi:MAG: ferrous iron transporter B [Ruminococcaceae bacterium]|nr:ferrous iron transporter B [Oscillospiraceae bacterium]
MCMGFGCNAAGVVGCRIIDSKRERLIAMLTNALVPCNGRFPTLIALISIFIITSQGLIGSVAAALILSGFIILSVLVTVMCSKLLSATILKGEPSSFVLELPPYRTPQFGRVIVRSMLDRTLFVLGRSVAFAAPAGLVLWLIANITVGDNSILVHMADFLEPFGIILGLDGAIILAFILALPANEIFLPIVLMIYNSGHALTEYSGYEELFSVLSANGWTIVTAICVILFTIFHFPCATTVMTIKKESGKLRYAVTAVVLPTLVGIFLCFIFNLFFKILLN